MIVRSRLLTFVLLAAACHAFHDPSRRPIGTTNREALERLQAYFAEELPHRFHPSRNGEYRQRQRSAIGESPYAGQPAHHRQWYHQPYDAVEPDEREIDVVGHQAAAVEETEAPPLALASVPEQRETAPAVVQELPIVDVKQQRAPLPIVERSDTPEAAPKKSSDLYFIALVAGCSGAAVFGVVAAGLCWYKLQKNVKAAAEADYPSYGVTGPSKQHASPPSGDRKLAQSAQMYHYQHQKQQMIAIEKAGSERHVSTSDLDSEEENEEGDYMVYECPGLASTGEMEVKNPLFQDETTPASPPITTTSKEAEK